MNFLLNLIFIFNLFFTVKKHGLSHQHGVDRFFLYKFSDSLNNFKLSLFFPWVKIIYIVV